MEYYLAPSAQKITHEMSIPEPFRKKLLSANGGLMKELQAAVQPFQFNIAPTGQGIQVTGDKTGVLIAERIIEKLAGAGDGEQPQSDIILSVIDSALKRDLVLRLNGISRPVAPMSLNQLAFIQTLLSAKEQLIIGAGPTGTGKTHMAIAVAINQLSEGRVKRVIITKPHVVLEGEVVTPTVRQDLEYDSQFEFLEDIFRDLIGYSRFLELKEQRKLELLPLGHFRGRTFNDSFIILDEAQNMTVRKMRMAVTSIGRASRMVITGDPIHVDLRDEEPSGLPHLLDLIQGTDLAKVHHFEHRQVIRNSLVAKLEKLYADQLDAV
ncbi:MAG: PhoH family protein [Methyloligellaceae bacterium]